MDIAHAMHGLETLGDLNKGIDDLHEIAGEAHIQWLAINQLHQQESFVHLEQHALTDFQIIGSAKIRMGELPRD